MAAEAQPQPPNGVPDDQKVLIIGSGRSIEMPNALQRAIAPALGPWNGIF
jgi:hypothetical protein